MLYDAKEILHQSFLTVLDPHVMDSIHEAYRKIGCRPNLRKIRPTCLADCPYLYVASYFMHLEKCPLMWNTKGKGELKYEVKRLNSSFLSSHPTRIWWIRFCVPVNSAHPPACPGLKIRQITAFLAFHWLEFHTPTYAKSLIWLTLTTSNLTSNSSFYHVTPT